jgi:hypothetical protein
VQTYGLITALGLLLMVVLWMLIRFMQGAALGGLLHG